jgi:hypothetical protein
VAAATRTRLHFRVRLVGSKPRIRAYDLAMSGRRGAEFDPLVVEVIDISDPPSDDDAIEPAAQRGEWWRIPRNIYLIAAALVIVAVIAAYQLNGHSKKGASAPVASSPSSAGTSASMTFTAAPPVVGAGAPVVGTGAQCATQVGPQQLQLGFEIANKSALPVTLMSLTSAFPLGGLRETAQTQGTCGQLDRPTPVAGFQLAAGATTWLSVTYSVEVDCPKPSPVSYTLVVAQSGHDVTINPGGFADLGGVTYSGCTYS